MKNKKILISVQARMGSTRFPGKTLEDLGGYTVLEYMFRRLKKSQLAHYIQLATTVEKIDDPVVHHAEKIGLKYCRGSEQDVLERIYQSARLAKADVVVHTTGDCPMIDAYLIDQALTVFAKGEYDCVGVGMNKNYPHGLDFYIISRELLERMHHEATTAEQREHAIDYVTSNPHKFKNLYLAAPQAHFRPDVRITVDYKEDLEKMNKMQIILGMDNFNYSIDEIIKAWDQIHRK